MDLKQRKINSDKKVAVPYSARCCKDPKTIYWDVNCSDRPIMLRFQENVLEVKWPQTNITIIRTSDAERLIHTHALQWQTCSQNIHVYQLSDMCRLNRCQTMMILRDIKNNLPIHLKYVRNPRNNSHSNKLKRPRTYATAFHMSVIPQSQPKDTM